MYVCGEFHPNQWLIKFIWLLKGLFWSMDQICINTWYIYTKMHAVSNHLVEEQDFINISPCIPLVMSMQVSILVITTLGLSCSPHHKIQCTCQL